MSFSAIVKRRGRRAAAIAQRRATIAIGDFVRAAFDGVDAEAETNGVHIAGRGLKRRAQDDARLRWLAQIWKDGR